MEIQVGDKFIIVDDDDAPILMRHSLKMADTGYCYVRMDQKHVIGLHRFIFGFVDNQLIVDHINRNPLDNRKCNLRLATKSQNGQNVNRRRDGRYLGVRKKRHGYEFYIASNGTAYYVGKYPTEEMAARARDSACLFLHGQFAVLNFPDETPVPMHPDHHTAYCHSIKPSRQALRARTTKYAKANNPHLKLGVKRDSRNGNYVAYSHRDRDGLDGYIGTFKTEEEAMEARDSVAKYQLGDEAALNFPRKNIEAMPVEYWRRKSRDSMSGGKLIGVSISKSGKFRGGYYPGDQFSYLGQYETAIDAGLARDAAVLHTYDNFNRYKLNFPDYCTIACPPDKLRKHAMTYATSKW